MSDNENEIKNTLNGYWRARQLIRVLENCIKEHDEFVEVCQKHDIAYENIDYNEILKSAYQDAVNKKNKVQGYIELMADYPHFKSVLYARYICGNNTMEIAEQMYCSRNTVLRYHKSAIKILMNKIKN